MSWSNIGGINLFNFDGNPKCVLLDKNKEPASNQLLKLSNRNTRKRYDICSKLRIKTPERRHRHC